MVQPNDITRINNINTWISVRVKKGPIEGAWVVRRYFGSLSRDQHAASFVIRTDE
jgi:hypothetical protein